MRRWCEGARDGLGVLLLAAILLAGLPYALSNMAYDRFCARARRRAAKRSTSHG